VNYLLDTNVISEIRKGANCNPNVAAWYSAVEDADIYLSVLVLGEIRKGVERARPKNPVYADVLEKWLSGLKLSFAENILPIDQTIADEWGRMSGKRPVSAIDALLAATAKVHRMVLATRNAADVADLGAEVLNPFDPRTSGY
jgi:predicted nucleic acid-binding protein